MKRPLIAVDWGTSSLRVALLDERGQAVEERSSAQGILAVQSGEFAAVLARACSGWPTGALTLISGMAGSKQGWMEAPYAACPAGFDDIAGQLLWVVPASVAIVPGLSCENHGVPDVMRGEETQVFGALEALALDSALLVLPGTHSKWVRATGRRIEGFSTFMTGETYALLAHHSILARTMPAGDAPFDEQAFCAGLQHAFTCGNLLQAAFSARTLSLFERLPLQLVPSYLSGIVIGEELRACPAVSTEPVIIVGNDALALRYSVALKWLGKTTRSPGPQAAWRGLAAIARSMH
ncbi:MAG: 2-dehydro-3-deoxygalactonokinase [Pseudomonadota bacterium]